MLNSSIPVKFNIPFASGATSPDIRPTPQASQIGIQNGAASLTDGFPPNCFIPAASGGAAPFGADFNGILNQITAWSQWQQSGGAITYDSTFQTAVGGYPSGAIVQSAVTPGLYWRSTADNNTTNPDAAGSGWVLQFAQLAGSATQTFKASGFIAAEGVSGFNGLCGYSFAELGSDTGMFSPSDGVAGLFGNGVEILSWTAGGASFVQPVAILNAASATQPTALGQFGTTVSGTPGTAGSYAVSVMPDATTPSGLRIRKTGISAAFSSETTQTITFPGTAFSGIFPGSDQATIYRATWPAGGNNDQGAQIIGATTTTSMVIGMAAYTSFITWPCNANWSVEGW